MRAILMVWAILCLYHPSLHAQEPGDSLTKLPVGFLSSIHKQVSSVDTKIGRENQKALRKWERQERQLLRKLSRVDSASAAQLRASFIKKDQQLKTVLADPSLVTRQYLPSLDTLNSSLKFLTDNPSLLPDKLSGAGDLLNTGSVDKLTRNLGQSEKISALMQEKQALLREKLSALGLGRHLKSLNKTAYYYNVQVEEYKSLLKDHKKAARKGLALLQQSKPFREFMRRNSQLASLFRLPGDPNDPNQAVNLAGLQTRAQVNSLIQQQVAAGGPGAAAQLRNNISQAQNQLNALKDKVLKLGGGGSDMSMPDGFIPNPYKTKSFLKRIDVGFNIQSQRSRGWLPARSDVGISLGYKFNPRFIAGIGGSYRIGWGPDIRHMKITHQGISLRSFVDLKLKGSFWLTGGYEQNHVAAADNEGNLTGEWAWQPSGLIGVSKVISLRSKYLKKTKLQLLWDFLAGRNGNTGQPILFRIGYGL